MIRILLADDHPVVREGLRGMLGAEPDLTVVGEASNGPQAEALSAELHPDIVLMDLRMPGGGGVESINRMRLAGLPCRVIVLTTYETDGDILRAVEAGAAGYLLKDLARKELADAIRAAARGETVLAPSVAAPGRPVAQPAGAATALGARDGGAAAGGGGVHERGDRAAAVYRGVDGEDASAAGVREAGGGGQNGGGDERDAGGVAVRAVSPTPPFPETGGGAPSPRGGGRRGG